MRSAHPTGLRSLTDAVVYRNIGVRGGVAPARTYIPELLDDVLSGRINPGRVFDFETDLEHIVDAYAAMDERRAIKSARARRGRLGRTAAMPPNDRHEPATSELFPGHVSTLAVTDPELIEVFDNFAFDEVLRQTSSSTPGLG